MAVRILKNDFVIVFIFMVLLLLLLGRRNEYGFTFKSILFIFIALPFEIPMLISLRRTTCGFSLLKLSRLFLFTVVFYLRMPHKKTTHKDRLVVSDLFAGKRSSPFLVWRPSRSSGSMFMNFSRKPRDCRKRSLPVRLPKRKPPIGFCHSQFLKALGSLPMGNYSETSIKSGNTGVSKARLYDTGLVYKGVVRAWRSHEYIIVEPLFVSIFSFLIMLFVTFSTS